MTAEWLDGFCAAVAAGFRVHEHRIPAPRRQDRDAAIVRYALAVLADPDNPGTAIVLEAIDRQRAHSVTAVAA